MLYFKLLRLFKRMLGVHSVMYYCTVKIHAKELENKTIFAREFPTVSELPDLSLHEFLSKMMI